MIQYLCVIKYYKSDKHNSVDCEHGRSLRSANKQTNKYKIEEFTHHVSAKAEDEFQQPNKRRRRRNNNKKLNKKTNVKKKGLWRKSGTNITEDTLNTHISPSLVDVFPSLMQKSIFLFFLVDAIIFLFSIFLEFYSWNSFQYISFPLFVSIFFFFFWHFLSFSAHCFIVRNAARVLPYYEIVLNCR